MISEDELIKACQKNDRIAQKELFDRYSGKMMAVCLRYCRNEEDARDLLQDGFFKVLTKIRTFKGNSKLETWMTRVFINLALNRLRQGRSRFYHEEFESRHEAEVSNTTESDEELPQKDPMEVLRAVQELPEIYRIVINMYAMDGMSHKEIAKALGITEGSSKSRLSRARVLLGQQLKLK